MTLVNFDFSAKPRYIEDFEMNHQLTGLAGSTIETARRTMQHEEYKKVILQLSQKKAELMSRRHQMDTGEFPGDTRLKGKTSSRLQDQEQKGREII